ncbi:hypothetical protein B0H14DRAFT_2564771 [Mycena olivaceomarginata]|nr:hypothetical protein B0H14DRAFT_2564771 [Mycena olivaceomarginata]
MLFATSMVILFSLAAASPNPELHSPNRELDYRSTYQVGHIGINLGYLTLNGDHVAWFSGLPKSDYTVIGPDSVNPCTRTFDLRKRDVGTTGTYQEFGCGTPDYGINKNGAYYAQCATFSEPDADGVHTEWYCS